MKIILVNRKTKTLIRTLFALGLLGLIFWLFLSLSEADSDSSGVSGILDFLIALFGGLLVFLGLVVIGKAKKDAVFIIQFFLTLLFAPFSLITLFRLMGSLSFMNNDVTPLNTGLELPSLVMACLWSLSLLLYLVAMYRRIYRDSAGVFYPVILLVVLAIGLAESVLSSLSGISCLGIFFALFSFYYYFAYLALEKQNHFED